jgi:hypothetical protein
MKKLLMLVFLIGILPLFSQKNIQITHLDGKRIDVKILNTVG